MKLKTKLLSSYLTIITLILVIFLIWYFEDIEGIDDRYTELASIGVQKVIDCNHDLSKETLTKFGLRNLILESELLSIKLSEKLKSMDISKYDQLRDDEDLRKLGTHDIMSIYGTAIGHFDLYDKNGMVILHPNKALEGENYSKWENEFPAMWRLVQESFTKDEVSGEYSFLGSDNKATEKFMLLRHIPETPFILCATVSKREYYTEVQTEIRTAGQIAVDEAKKAMENSESELRSRTILLAVTGVIILLLIGTALAYSYSESISKPLMNLCDAVTKIGKGDFSIKVQLPDKTFSELEVLAGNFNMLGARLSLYIEKLRLEITAREAIEGEINAARRIQESLLPGKSLEIPGDDGLSLYAALLPAKNVSGDFYDYFFLGDGRLALVVADVSGKGIPAALFMAVCRTLIRTISVNMGILSPAKILGIANKYLCADNETSMFVTLFICIFNPKTGELRFSNAGHNPGLLFDSKKNCSEFGNFKKLPLGIDPELQYTESTLTIANKSTIFLYTDGITEAMSPDKRMYGDKRLLDFLHEKIDIPLENVGQALLNEVSEFQKDKQFDDITLAFLRRN